MTIPPLIETFKNDILGQVDRSLNFETFFIKKINWEKPFSLEYNLS